METWVLGICFRTHVNILLPVSKQVDAYLGTIDKVQFADFVSKIVCAFLLFKTNLFWVCCGKRTHRGPHSVVPTMGDWNLINRTKTYAVYLLLLWLVP